MGNQVQWEDVPKAQVSDQQWEDVPSSSFKSGSAFEDTKSLIPDVSALWERFKKEWANRKNTPMTDEDMKKMMADEHAAGSGVFDAVGALPAMAVGGVAGIGSGIANLDASKGLQTGSKVMNNLMPSTLMGNENDQQSEGYKTMMAPYTAVMDTLNAVPQGYGEMLNASGHTDAAGQLTDAGKLAIMTTMGVKGAHEAYSALTAKLKEKPKLSDPREEAPKWEDVPSTAGHADDFATINPYDVGGHVSEAMDGRPATIDNAQPDLFGSQILEDSIAHPQGEELLNQIAEEKRQAQVDQGIANWEPTKSYDTVPPTGIMQDAFDRANRNKAFNDLDAQKQAEIDAAYDSREASKQADYAKMEAQRELDHMNTVSAIESSPTRSFFLDPKNMDKVDFHDDHSFANDTLGDKSLMTPEHTQTMAESLTNGDAHGALDVIANNHDNVIYRKLANFLKDKLDGIKVVTHDEGILQMGDRHATGYYDPTTRTVGLSKVGAVSPHTVLHELVHAVTSDFINNRPSDMRVMGINSLFKDLSGDIVREFPSITNPKEFVAEAFSNPEFQDFLKKQRMNNRTVWQRFVDTVKNMLGIRPNIRTDLSDALEHTLDLGKQIAEAQTSGLDQFKAAGVPNKLADLMATNAPERPNAVANNENMKALKGLGKIKAQFDFTPLKPEEVIPMAREAKDIPASTLETIKANLDAGGRFASLRHSNNPVVKYTFAYVDHAVKAYEKLVRDNITNKDNGVKTLLQNLGEDDFTAVHQQMMLDEGVIERTPQQLRELGWSDKMIAAHQRMRQVDREMLAKVNEVRAQMNPPLPPIDARIGHLAGRFLGDFSHIVYELNEDGTRKKAVMRLTGSTKWGAKDLADFVAKEHPEWEVGEQEYNGIKKNQNSDRFSGFMEMMNYIAKNDKAVAKALDSLDKYNRRAATNYLNALRHAKEKKVQPGGIIGSEGHKFWVDAKTNAEQGFKGHLAYLDTTYKWIEMQKAMENISKVTTDPDVIQAQPNAIKWSTAYTDHALHRNQGFLTDMAQSLLSEIGRVTGVGHTNITKGINWMSTAEMRNWMGIGNIPFAIKHMVLPFQKMPAMMTYLKTVGDVESSMVMAGMRSLSSYYHYLKGEPTTPFEREAFKYAKDNNVFNVTLDNLSGNIQSSQFRRFMGKVADADFSGPEHAIRGTSFFFYAHLLEKAGLEPQSALSAAEHLSKFLYTDYAPHEAPRAAAKAGWIGQLAFQITRYKTNEIGQLTFFNRERLKGEDHDFMEKLTSNLPLTAHIGSLLAFSGVTGMLAYKEMDEVYSLFRKYVMGKPDNLTALLQRSKAPELVKYGMSSLIGIDSKITEAELLPSPFPTTAAEISQMGMAFNAVRYHDSFHAKQLALSLTPSTFRGPMENKLFTQPLETQGPHKGKGLYLNPNTGEGRVWRTPEQQHIRDLGFHTITETDETENSYAQKRIMADNADLAKHILEKAKGLMASNALTQEKAMELARQYAKYQQRGQPDFSSALVTYAVGRHTSQREQMELRAAGDRRMGNSLNIIEKNK